MKLEEYIGSLDKGKKEALIGFDTTDVKHGAFPSKRVVHAGLIGEPIAREKQQETWQQILQEEADDERLHAVYVHIPFCQTKCLYCSFYQNASRQDVEDKYIESLLTEIRRDSGSRQMQTAVIDSVFIGGGTPSSLSPANAERLLAAIQESFHFAPRVEITLEGRIHDLVLEKMKVWKAGGVNRVSLGVQSFDTAIRQRVGRIDTREEVIARLEALKEYGMTTIVDLIYGLPGQTMESWMKDIETLLTVPIDGMDLYQLNVFPGGALAKAVEAGTVPACADIAGQTDLYRAARDYLLERGVERLSLCHYRRDTQEKSRYNTMVKTGAVVYPFGCGAGGNAGGITFMHERHIDAYEERIARGEKPVMMMAHQVEKRLQRVSDEIVSGLETGFVDFRRLTMMDVRLTELSTVLKLWEKRGLMKSDLAVYRLTAEGEFWYISMSQSLVECAQALMEETVSEPAVEGKGSSALDRVLSEVVPDSTADERAAMVKKMPAPVRMMLRHSSYDALKSMLAGLPPAMRDKMLKRAEG